MALPADLVLVRHGQSEANLVKDEIKAGNAQAYTDAFAKAKNWQTRLTDKGREQAKAAGEYIRAEIGERFDARFFSYFVRTRETAGLLGVDGPNWQRSPYLHERDWGMIDSPAPVMSMRWVGPHSVTSWPNSRCQTSSSGKPRRA